MLLHSKKIRLGLFSLSFYVLLGLFICFSPMRGQVVVTLTEITPPTPFIDDWQTTPFYLAQLQNVTNELQQVHLRLNFTGQNRSFSTISPLQTLPPLGTLVLTNVGSGSAALVDWNAFTAENIRQINDLGRDVLLSGILPEGIYRVCPVVLDASKSRELGTGPCLEISLSYPEQPFWILPDSYTMALPVIQFSWTYTGSPSLRPRMRYRLRVAEILPNQTPEKALQANVPILDNVQTEQSQYIYQTGKDLPMLPYRRYAARVTQGVIDNNGVFKIFGQAGGLSPIKIFLHGMPLVEPIITFPAENGDTVSGRNLAMQWINGISDPSQAQYLGYRFRMAKGTTLADLERATTLNRLVVNQITPLNKFPMPQESLPAGNYIAQVQVIRLDDAVAVIESDIRKFIVQAERATTDSSTGNNGNAPQISWIQPTEDFIYQADPLSLRWRVLADSNRASTFAYHLRIARDTTRGNSPIPPVLPETQILHEPIAAAYEVRCVNNDNEFCYLARTNDLIAAKPQAGDTVFFVQVRAINSNGLEVAASEIRRFRVIRSAYSNSGDTVVPAVPTVSIVTGRAFWTADNVRGPSSAGSRFLPRVQLQLWQRNTSTNRTEIISRATTNDQGYYRFEWIDTVPRVRGGNYRYSVNLVSNIADTSLNRQEIIVRQGDSINWNEIFRLQSFTLRVRVLRPQEESIVPFAGVDIELRRIVGVYGLPDEGNLSDNRRAQLGFPAVGSGQYIASFYDTTRDDGTVVFQGIVINSNEFFDAYQLYVSDGNYFPQTVTLRQQTEGIIEREITLEYRPSWFSGRAVNSRYRNEGISGVRVTGTLEARIRPGDPLEIYTVGSGLSDASGYFTIQPPATITRNRNDGSRVIIYTSSYHWIIRDRNNSILDRGTLQPPNFRFRAEKSGWSAQVLEYNRLPVRQTDIIMPMTLQRMNARGIITTRSRTYTPPRPVQQPNNNGNIGGLGIGNIGNYNVNNNLIRQPQPVAGARAESPSSSEWDESNIDGEYSVIIPRAAGNQTLRISKPGFKDTTVRFTISDADVGNINDTAAIRIKRLDTIELQSYTQNIRVTVLGERNEPLPNALVSLAGEGLDARTNNSGNVLFSEVPMDIRSLSVRAEGYIPGGIDFTPSANQQIELRIQLERGGTIRGTTRTSAGGRILSGVQVVVIGFEDVLTATSDSLGNYIINGTPTGSIQIIARRNGYRAARQNVQVAQNQPATANITLDSLPTPVQKIFGFPVSIERILPDPARPNTIRVDGAFTIPNVGDLAALTGIAPNFSFRDIVLDVNTLSPEGNIAPIDGQMRLLVREIEISFLEEVRALIKNSNGIRVAAASAGGLLGSLRDSLELELGDYFSSLPGVQALGKLQLFIREADRARQQAIGDLRNFIPFFTPPNFPPVAITDFLPRCQGTPSVVLNGYRFVLDCANSEFSRRRLLISGRVELQIPSPRIDSIRFAEIEFTRNGLQRASAQVQPPIRMTLAEGWFLEARGARFSLQNGFSLDGTAQFRLPGDNTPIALEFTNLRAGLQGISGGAFSLSNPLRLYDIVSISNLQHLSFTMNNRVFGLRGSGRITLPGVNWDVNLEQFAFSTDGRFQLTLPTNMNYALFNVANFQLQSLSIRRIANSARLQADGHINLNIPSLAVQAGNISFLRGGSFEVGRVGIDFNPGPARVRGQVEYNQQQRRFSGECEISVAGAFSVEARFMRSPQEFDIAIAAGVTIPLGTATITRVGGRIAHNAAQRRWLFGFSGVVAIAPATENALAADLRVDVESNPQGVVISGMADLELATYSIARANIVLDFPRRRFTGNVNVNINQAGIRINGTLNIGVLPQDRTYYLDAAARLDLWNLADVQARVIIGHNYRADINTINADGNFRQQRTISGFFTSISSRLDGFDRNFDVWVAEVSLNAYANYDASMFLASNFRSGDIRMRANIGGGADVSVVGFSIAGAGIDGSFYTQIGYNDARFYFNATASVTGSFRLGSAPRSCNSWKTVAYVIPVGAKVCFNARVGFRYNTPNASSGFAITSFSL